MAFNISDSDWQDFERLVFKLLLDEYGIEESDINRLTQAKNDGGYDGIFYIPCFWGDQNTNKGFIRTLFEAKLRSDLSHSLPLQEFSKALIISINRNANRCIIATNLYFSQGTIDTLLEYSNCTGLEIRFLTAHDICQWLESGGLASVEPDLSSSNLLDFLQESYAKNRLKAQSSSEQSIYISRPSICLEEVIGQKRKKAVEKVVETFQQFPGVITVEGEVGIGKSIFTNQVLRTMEERGTYNIQKIDIEYYRTPRVLFIKLLDHIWHIPFQILNALDENTVKDILRWIGDWEIPEEMRQTLMSVFSKSVEEYHHFSDLFNYYLTEYLYQIYNIVKVRKIPLLCFSNVNYADEDLLRFLLLIIKKFDGNVCVLLELRTSLYIDGRVSDQIWSDFLSEIWQLPYLRQRIQLETWKPDEILTFIRNRIKPLRFSLHCMNIIQKRVGRNPLHLNTFLSYLSLSLKNKDIPDSYWEEYISNYPLETIDHTIFLLIGHLTRTVPQAMEIFFLLGILKGHAPPSFLDRCIEQSVENTLDYLATKTPLIRKGQGEIYVSHSLYLAALQRYDYISVFSKQHLSEQVLSCLDELQLDTFHREALLVDLLQILNAHNKVAEHAYDLAKALFQDGQFQASYCYFTIAKVCLEDMGTVSGESLFRCMLGQIQSRLQLEDFTLEDMRQIMEDCKDALSHSALPLETVRECQIEYLIVENKLLHYFGRFPESLSKTQEILSLLYRCECHNEELIGSMWAEYGVAIKETSTLQNALETLEKAMVICPESKYLRFVYLTHMSARYASFDPKQARTYLLEIQALEPFLNLPDRVHNRVNLATIQFYCGNCDEAQSDGSRLIRETYNLGMRNEEGRLANLLGCVALHRGDRSEAHRCFKRGLDIFHRESYVAYLWPLLANLSTLYWQCSSHQEAFCTIQQCVNILRNSYSRRIKQTPAMGQTYEKIHIALILLTGTLLELDLPNAVIQPVLDEIFTLAAGSAVIETLRKIKSHKVAVELACSSAFCVKGEIYIKD